METQNIEPLEEKNDVEEVEEEEVQAPKKPRTEKQIEAFKKVIEKRNENRKIRAEEKQNVAEQEKVVLEEKILKKAVSIKKKKIKQELILDAISDDDEPIEQIKQKIVKSKKPIMQPLPIEPEKPKRPTIYFM
jgi:hypothetical protein